MEVEVENKKVFQPWKTNLLKIQVCSVQISVNSTQQIINLSAWDNPIYDTRLNVSLVIPAQFAL
jgi:hypothetical protein